MNILLLGSGGREHAFAWKLKQSPLCDQLYVAPGNAGTWDLRANVGISPTDFPALKEFVLEKQIDLVVVGPEDPLVKGIFDFFANDPELASVRRRLETALNQWQERTGDPLADPARLEQWKKAAEEWKRSAPRLERGPYPDVARVPPGGLESLK